MQNRIGPFFPHQEKPSIYAMKGDEAFMFGSRNTLDERGLSFVDMMEKGILPYTMAVLAASRSNNVFFLDKAFLQKEEFFSWHLKMYKKIGLKTSKHLHFLSPDTLYQSALQYDQEHPEQFAGISSICYSYDVNESTPIEDALQKSILANSKVTLATQAKENLLDIPESFIIQSNNLVTELDSKKLKKSPLFLKVDGLGGGYNVKRVSNIDEVKAFAATLSDNINVVVQECVDTTRCNEYIADFSISATSIDLLNVRPKLTYDDHWIGNVYSPAIQLSVHEVQNLYRCARMIREQGYVHKNSLVCGIDYFKSITRQYLTEVNARWTGGMPVYLLLKKLGILNSHFVVSHLDMLHADDVKSYQKFCKKHLFQSTEGNIDEESFSVIPLSFGPHEDDGMMYIWLLVLGNYQSFYQKKKKAFKKRSLPLSKNVKQSLEEKAYYTAYTGCYLPHGSSE